MKSDEVNVGHFLTIFSSSSITKSRASKFFLPKKWEVFFSVITFRSLPTSIRRLTLSRSWFSIQSRSDGSSSGVGGSMYESLFQSNLVRTRLSLRRHFISYLEREPNSSNSESTSLYSESQPAPSQSLIFSFQMQAFSRWLQILRFSKAVLKDQSLLEWEMLRTSLEMICWRDESRSVILSVIQKIELRQ